MKVAIVTGGTRGIGRALQKSYTKKVTKSLLFIIAMMLRQELYKRSYQN